MYWVVATTVMMASPSQMHQAQWCQEQWTVQHRQSSCTAEIHWRCGNHSHSKGGECIAVFWLLIPLSMHSPGPSLACIWNIKSDWPVTSSHGISTYAGILSQSYIWAVHQKVCHTHTWEYFIHLYSLKNKQLKALLNLYYCVIFFHCPLLCAIQTRCKTVPKLSKILVHLVMSWQYTISGHSSCHLHWFNIGFEMGRFEVWNGGYKVLKTLAEHFVLWAWYLPPHGPSFSTVLPLSLLLPPCRYKVVSYPMAAQIAPTPKNCAQVVMQAGLENWAIGRTKVFLKYFHVERLTQIMSSYHKAATQMEKSGWQGTLALHKHRPCITV